MYFFRHHDFKLIFYQFFLSLLQENYRHRMLLFVPLSVVDDKSFTENLLEIIAHEFFENSVDCS